MGLILPGIEALGAFTAIVGVRAPALWTGKESPQREAPPHGFTILQFADDHAEIGRRQPSCQRHASENIREHTVLLLDRAEATGVTLQKVNSNGN